VRTLSPALAIPDNSLAGVNVGTINTVADGTRFLDVVASLKVTHTWVGDLVATLTYDETCDGTPEASSRFVCRPAGPRATTCWARRSAASSNLSCNNTMYFSDAAVNVLGTSPAGCGTPPPSLPPAAGRVAPTPSRCRCSTILRKGGCCKLNVADYGAGDLGTVCEWGVYTLNESIVPVASTTVGPIKSLRLEN
jgi:hypothetical protein